MSDLGSLACDAGRTAFYGGRWMLPCLKQPVRHHIAFSEEIGGPRVPGTPTLKLCDQHAEQLIFDGVIEEALIDNDEWDRRVEGT